MAESICRSCGAAVVPGAAACPACGINDPIAAQATPRPAGTETGAGAGARLKNAGKAIGCFVVALVVLGIAIAVGLLDFLF